MVKQKPSDNAFELVRAGYDKIARRYVKEREEIDIREEVQEFCDRLPQNAKVLDVGCGTGLPILQFLIQSGFESVGIDLSTEMITVARENLPGTEILQMNMTELDFPADSFDGLISCYSVFHVPRKQHAAVFQSFHSVLKSKGVMLVSIGASEWEEVEDYYDTKMFWSHYDPTTTETLITDAGFDIEFGRKVSDGGETHHWVLARKR